MKTTKKAKRIIAFAAALSLSACMMAMPAGTASAADSNTITIADSSDGFNHSVYYAYQIFDGTYKSAPQTESAELNVTGWGNGINSSDFLAALKASKVFGEGDANVFHDITIKTTNDDSAKLVAEKLSDYGDKSQGANEFARLALRFVNNSRYTSSSNSITNLPDGYYVVADSEAANTKNDGSGDKGFTLGMLVAGGKTMNVSTKIGLPTVVKKVQENSDVDDYTGNHETELNYNDVADYNIGDAVPFRLYGTMPSNISEYKAYYYKFSDTLSPGLDLPESITVKVGTDTITFNKGTEQNTAEYTYTPYTTTTDKNCRIAATTNKTSKVKMITVSFEDVKVYNDTKKASGKMEAASEITVSYNSKLNSSAVIGLDGNLNTVELSYLNNPNLDYKPDITDDKKDGPRFDDNSTPDNPYDDTYHKPTVDGPDSPDNPKNPNSPNYNPQSPETPIDPKDGPYNDTDVPDTPGTPDNPDTPNPNEDNNNPHTNTSTPDKVVVFTYEVDVTKEDSLHHENKLGGAEFTLQNESGDYAMVNTDGVLIGWMSSTVYNSITGESSADDKTKKASTVLTSSNIAGDNKGKIFIKGLDDGTYTLTETKEPDGYNKPGTNNTLEFMIDATTSNGQSWDGSAALTALSVKKTNGALLNSLDSLTDKTNAGNKNTGIVSFEIYNTKGATLPSTGGMGTTVFLLTGGTVAGAAAILYITKKRTSAEAK